MKNFLIKSGVFFAIFAGVYFIMLHKLSGGYVDVYYPKFTQKTEGLIIGLSRAHTGISPEILENSLEDNGFEFPIINFAFDKFQSPYGEVYLNGIKKKLKNSSGKGLYVIAVSPGDFTAPHFADDEFIKKMDDRMIMGKLDNYTKKPNYDYIINCYGQPLYTAFFPERAFKFEVSHKNGWNEIQRVRQGDSISRNTMRHWRKMNLRLYEKYALKEKPSEYRISYFKETVSYLTKKGDVFIIRLPVHSDVRNLEEKLWPKFDSLISSVSKQYNVPYLNYISRSKGYETYDGSHLLSQSAKKFTDVLASDITKAIETD